MLTAVVTDVLYALRTLRRARGFAVGVVLTLGIGMGVTAVIFDVARSAFLAPLPYARPSALVHVSTRGADGAPLPASYPEYRRWREGADTLASIAAYSRTNKTLTGTGTPARLAVTQVSASFFSTLGVPVTGRDFRPAEERAGADHVAIVTYAFWQDRLGGADSAIGSFVALSGTRYQVIGILPVTFRFDLDSPDLFVPLGITPLDEASVASRWLGVIARLREGTTPAAASAELTARLAGIDESDTAATAAPLQAYIVGGLRPVLLALAGGALFVFVAACASVASLVSARVLARRRELAVRAAIGASHAALWRLVTAELAIVSAAASAASALFASWTLAVLPHVAPAAILSRAGVQPAAERAPVAALAIALPVVAIAASLLAALPDLRRAGRATALTANEGGRGASRVTVRRWLVAAQVAVAAVLLVGASLLGRSVARLIDVPLGFTTDGVSAIKISIAPDRYRTAEQVAAFYARLSAAASSIPGVTRASIIDELPLTKDTGAVNVAPAGEPSASRRVSSLIRSAGPGYFETLGIRVLGGRTFREADTADAVPVVVLSRRLANVLFPGGDAVGRRVTFGHPTVYVVAGVVDDVIMGELDRHIRPAVYTCALQDPSRSSFLVLRSTLPLSTLLPTFRERLAALDPEVPAYGASTLRETRNGTAGVAERTSVLWPIATFGLLTLIVAALGVHGILSYFLAQRTREVGIRIALGARPADILGYAMRQGLGPVSIGLVAGIGIAAACTRVAASLLFGIAPFDPAAFAGAAAVILGVAIVACGMPAIRAARLDPAVALSRE